VYTQQQAIAIMRHSSSQDKTYDLAFQLIAAILNTQCNGANASCIQAQIDAAQAFLCAHPIGSGVTANSSAWQSIKTTFFALEKYNTGKSCAPSCDNGNNNSSLTSIPLNQ
jgi:hypothetical protein